MTADPQIKINDRIGIPESRRDVAEPFVDDRDFGGKTRLEFTGSLIRRKNHGKLLDFDRYQLGGIFCSKQSFGENRRHRLSDVPDIVAGEYRLAIRLILLDPALPKVDRRDIENVRGCPNRNNARVRRGVTDIDRPNPAVGTRRADDPHVKLAREIDIAGEAALAGDQRVVFKPGHRPADEIRWHRFRRRLKVLMDRALPLKAETRSHDYARPVFGGSIPIFLHWSARPFSGTVRNRDSTQARVLGI
jgi:hypothetical protein